MGQKRPDAPSEALPQLFGGFESLLLQGTGANEFNPNQSRVGQLLRNASREELSLMRQFGPKFIQQQSRLQRQAIRANPLANDLFRLARQATAGQGELVSQALGGLEQGGILPADLERQAIERARGIASARGLIDSPQGGLLEIASLLGGSEAIRSQRLAQAQSIFGGAQAPGLAFSGVQGAPSFSPFGIVNPNQTIQTALPGAINRQLQDAQFAFQQQQALGSSIAQGALLVGGGTFGALNPGAVGASGAGGGFLGGLIGNFG